ncbi:MAG: cell division protein FtsQ/DivIB [Rhodopila sp.]
MPRVTRSPRNSVYDRPSPWLLLLRRQRRFLLPGAGIGVALMAVFLIANAFRATVPAGSGGSLTSLQERLGNATATLGLRVSDIVVEGRANTPDALLRAAIGVNKGDPILGFSLEQARARIETLSWVEHATVERRMPGTVVVFLQERAPFAIWQNQGKFVLVDRVGQTVTNQDISQFHNLPLIVGAGAPVTAATLLDALTERPMLAEKVAASVRVGERRWNLRMTSGIDVMLSEGHEAVALDRLIQLQREHAVLDRPLAAIDLRLPDRFVLRPKPESKDGTVMPPIPPTGSGAPTVPVIAKKST